MNEWEEWRERAEAARQRLIPQPKPKEQREPAPARTITAEELRKVKRLHRVDTGCWNQDRRFIQQFSEASGATQLTERQAWFIEILWYKYRRQLGHNDPKPVGYQPEDK